MGRDGLLGLSRPKQYGGQERPAVDQFIFADEVQATAFPLPFLTLNTIGPTLRKYGTEEQKQHFLPKILAGEVFFSVGYSEPSAGTDLASLRTTAVRDGDEWEINGQKMSTSLAHYADYVWLAARTDPEAEKHSGLSIFLVPTGSPGFSRQEIRTVGGVSTAATFYDDVRVQAFHQRAADAYINVEAIRLSALEAVWRLSRDLPADEHVAVAKFWAAEGGQSAAFACQHLHGGIGIDVDYPLHRYFLWAIQIEHELGSAQHQLERLGRTIAAHGLPAA